MAESEEHRRVVAEAVRSLAGAPLRPRYELREAGEEPLSADAPPEVSDEELVERFVAEFDAEELVDDEEGGA